MPWWLDINQIFDHFLNWVTTSILNCFDARTYPAEVD